MPSQTRKVNGYSYVRAIAAIAIVLIHTVSAFVSTFGADLSVGGKILYYSVQNNMMWAVPCFLMVSGALLLNPNREITLKKLYSKYFLRVALALVIFGMLYYLYECLAEGAELSLSAAGTALYNLFAGKTWNHMWYLYCLLGLYMLLPMFKLVTQTADRKQIRYLLIIFLILRSLISLLDMFGIECGIYLHLGTIYPFYLFLGYYLRRWKQKTPTILYWAAFVTATLLIIGVNFLQYTFDLSPLSRLYAYNSILVILQAYGLFGILFGIKAEKVPFIQSALLTLDDTSFGVYLVHLILIRLLCVTLKFNALAYGGIFMILLITLAVTLISAALVWVLKKIPGVRFIL